MTQLKAGVIGAGVFGGHHARKFLAEPRVQLLGVFDPDDERAETLATDLGIQVYDTADALLRDIDVITIASPPEKHFSAARHALLRSKHVLVEKPLATAVEEGQSLISLANAHKAVLACGHQERLVFEAMGLFAAPEKPTLIESVREGPWTGRSVDVSVTLDLTVHDLDLALQLMQAPPSRVTARGRAARGQSADTIEARLTFDDGAEALFVASRIAEERARTMRVVYPSGEVRIDFLARSFDNTTGFPLRADFAQTPSGRDPLGANVARFLDAVLGKAERPAVTGEEALAVLELALAVDAAAKLPSLSN